MDIASLSMNMNTSQILSDVSTAVLGKNLDTMESAGAGLVASINAAPSPSLESMVNPAVGGNIDLTV